MQFSGFEKAAPEQVKYREALGEPAQLLVPDVPAQLVQLLLHVSGDFPAQQRRRAGNHGDVCRDGAGVVIPAAAAGSCRSRTSPVFPMTFSHGCSVRTLSRRGEMSGVSDHSRTVLSLLQLAMVNGRLWWHVRPSQVRAEGEHLSCSCFTSVPEVPERPPLTFTSLQSSVECQREAAFFHATTHRC